MTLEYKDGDQHHPFLSCDADGCLSTLLAKPGNFELGSGTRPASMTGWVTGEVDGERRDYCRLHADQADG